MIWTAPLAATYEITATGGSGGSAWAGAGAVGGFGAVVSARFALAAGATLQILVGGVAGNADPPPIGGGAPPSRSLARRRAFGSRGNAATAR